jgi:hypothetical protein
MKRGAASRMKESVKSPTNCAGMVMGLTAEKSRVTTSVAAPTAIPIGIPRVTRTTKEIKSVSAMTAKTPESPPPSANSSE